VTTRYRYIYLPEVPTVLSFWCKSATIIIAYSHVLDVLADKKEARNTKANKGKNDSPHFSQMLITD
jgi:hypothetical protein